MDLKVYDIEIFKSHYLVKYTKLNLVLILVKCYEKICRAKCGSDISSVAEIKVIVAKPQKENETDIWEPV